MARKAKDVQHAEARADPSLREIVEYGDDCGFEETVRLTPAEWAETDRINAGRRREARAEADALREKAKRKWDIRKPKADVKEGLKKIVPPDIFDL